MSRDPDQISFVASVTHHVSELVGEGVVLFENVEVTVTSSGETIAKGETNIDGIVEFRLQEGEYTLSIEGMIEAHEEFEAPGPATVNVPEHENHVFSLIEPEQEEPPADGNETGPVEPNESEPPANGRNETNETEPVVLGVIA